MKKLKGELTGEQIDEFFKEVVVFANLRPHTNVVTFYGACTKSLCIVSEFVSKGSLVAYLHSKAKISKQQLLSIMKGIAEGILFHLLILNLLGLRHIHQEGLVHRDIAARNILLQEQNEQLIPKISDFGLSRNIGMNNIGHTKSEVGPLKWMVISDENSKIILL